MRDTFTNHHFRQLVRVRRPWHVLERFEVRHRAGAADGQLAVARHLPCQSVAERTACYGREGGIVHPAPCLGVLFVGLHTLVIDDQSDLLGVEAESRFVELLEIAIIRQVRTITLMHLYRAQTGAAHKRHGLDSLQALFVILAGGETQHAAGGGEGDLLYPAAVEEGSGADFTHAFRYDHLADGFVAREGRAKERVVDFQLAAP